MFVMSVNSDTILSHDINLHSKDLRKICGKSNQVMVYGWKFCKYEDIKKLLHKNRNDPNSPIRKVFDCSLGLSTRQTLEGHYIETFPIQKLFRNLYRHCKLAIINLIFENYKRKKQGLDLIPLIFCVDIDDGAKQFQAYTSMNIIGKDLNEYGIKFTTKQELRLCYKICCEFENKEINDIAKETIKFIKLVTEKPNQYRIKQLEPFWLDKDWDEAWKESMKTKSDRTKVAFWENAFIQRNWKIELAKKIEEFDQSFASNYTSL